MKEASVSPQQSAIPQRSEGNCPLCGCPDIKIIYSRELKGVWYLARCSECRIHFVQPCPDWEWRANYYSGDYHTPLCKPGATEKVFGPKYHKYSAWIGRFVSSGRSLDVGCSTGLFPSMLRDLGWDAVGLEINQAVAEWGSQHYGVPIHKTTLQDAEFKTNYFDLITMTDVLEHMDGPVEFLRLVKRLMADKGYVFVTFPDIESLESRYYRLMSRLFRRPWLWIRCNIPKHIWEFSKATAERCFHQAGFRVVGFRRWQPRTLVGEGRLRMLSLPLRPLELTPFSQLFGSQMWFMLQREEHTQNTYIPKPATERSNTL
jgi:SAM-dependent methyltransferase